MFRSSLPIIYCLVCVFMFQSCKGQAKNKVPLGRITAVAFYNLENLYDPANDPDTDDEDFTPGGTNRYTEKIYREKLHNMAFALSQLAIDKNPDGPALIGLAEMENKKVLQDLIAEPELAKRHLKIIHFDSPDNRGIDVALLYHPDYFTIISAKPLPVNLSRNGRTERTRDVLYVTGKLGIDTVHVLVNHWPSRREGESTSAWKRSQAARVSKHIIDSLMLRNKNTNCILMGDLNDDPIDESVAHVLAASGNKQEVKPGGLYNPWTALYQSGHGTEVYHNQWNLFDQIIVSSGLLSGRSGHLKFVDAEIFDRDFLKNTSGRQRGYPHRSFSGNRWIHGFSDHFPTLIYLSK